jgi:CubicO group peptidase (beta-lactamase class C family)
MQRLALLIFLLAWPQLRAQVPGVEWERLPNPESLGWSREALQPAREWSASLKTEAVMIVVGGKVLDAWGRTDERFNVHSIRKSFISALYGLRVHDGTISLRATLDELGVNDTEPALNEVERSATVADLLKARSGVYHPALYETKRMKEARPARYSHIPGSFWYYNNWDFNALGTIYEAKCGAGIFEDFKRLIADPIGMQDFRVSDGSYVTGDDSIHRAYPFRMSARDMARFGLLYLRGGRWGDRQVVPADWVKESTTSYSDAKASGGYGYLWWISVDGRHLPNWKAPEGTYSARGAGGHYILILPSHDLVLVHRVNTDVRGREVASADFGKLVALILQARRDGR